MNYFKLSMVKKIKWWKDKYRDTPNGYFVSQLIGEQYINPDSLLSASERRKRKARGL